MKKSEYVLPALAALLVMSAVSIVLILCFHTVPTANAQMLNIFIGALIAYAGQAASYYFGSSKGSTDKDATIAGAIQSTPDPTIVHPEAPVDAIAPPITPSK